nr:uncharacterized protein LOC116430078 isoform X2 [Nomia melanderi]
MRVDQIGLLLWKNYIVRKRQPGILALVFVWPVIVFMILYTIRDNMDPKYHPTCQFPARSMPGDGLLPFVQSFICSLGNPCDPLPEYEEVPSYRNATLGPLVGEFQRMFDNRTILSAVKTLPNSIQLLKSMAQILTKPENKALFDRGIRLGDLFSNHEQLKRILREQMPNARDGLIDELFESSIKLLYLIDTFGSSNIDGVICSPDSLKMYLILPNEENYAQVSKMLCGIDSDTIPDILGSLSKHLDFSGLLEMVDRVMAKFRDYDFFLDMKRTAETILDLQTSKKFIPEYLRIQQWMPKMIMALKNVTFREIDLTFVNKTLEILNPVFSSEDDWPIAREAFLRLQKLLELIKEMIGDQPRSFSWDFFTVIQRIKSAMRSMSFSVENAKKLTRILDASIVVLQSGTKLAMKILDRHKNDLNLDPEIEDGLKRFFSRNIANPLGFAIAYANIIVRTVQHAAIIHGDLEHRLYNISLNNKDTVQQLLTDVDPSTYRTFVQAFSRLDLLEEFMQKSNVEDHFCEKETLKKVFDSKDVQRIGEILCSGAGKKFIGEAYRSIELEKFAKNVEDIAITTLLLIFGGQADMEKFNLTGLLSSVNDFMSFMNSSSRPDPDWSVFGYDQRWKDAFRHTESQGRLNVLELHLVITAKEIKIQYPTLKPHLKSIDLLLKAILEDLNRSPNGWVEEVKRHKAELIETFYLTAADRSKVLKILEYDNFTATYCVYPISLTLVNFPSGSNATALKTLICRLSSLVESYLDLNVTAIKLGLSPKDAEFNWHQFDARAVEFYRHVDALIHQKDLSNRSNYLQKLKRDFRNSWTNDLSVRDGFEISVGLTSKLFTLLESPLFNVKESSGWKNISSIGWTSMMIVDMVQAVLLKVSTANQQPKENQPNLLLPETTSLLSVILFNMRDLILDAIDIIIIKPINLIDILQYYKTQEKQWPCVHTQSVGAVLELRKGSRAVIEKIEKLGCKPDTLYQEWKSHPYFYTEKPVKRPPFDWVHLYSMIRRMSGNFENWLMATEKSLSDSLGGPTQGKPDVLGGFSTLKSIFDERWEKTDDDMGYVLITIDEKLDEVVPAFRSELKASNVWSPDVSNSDRMLVTLKFLSNVVHNSVKIVSDILRNDLQTSDQFVVLDWLSLLGFNGLSPIRIYYKRLPYILATLVNGLADPDTERRVSESLLNKTSVSCARLFSWWSTSVTGLTADEYRILKNFTCDLDPDHFNDYTNFYLDVSSHWRAPAKSYRSYMTTVIGDVYDLANTIGSIVHTDVKIDAPFSRAYLLNLLQELRSSLEGYNETDADRPASEPYEWSEYRLIVEGLSEVLLHVAENLKDVKVQDDRIDIWDFVGSGDARQLLKILEAHPEETIGLMAQVIAISARTDTFSYENVRKLICNARDPLTYWSTANRSRFIQEVCSFDPYQLLRSVTSEEYYIALTNRKSNAPTITPLSASLVKLIDVVLNLTSEVPDLTVKSNVLDPTTWVGLSNDTLAEIREIGRSWPRRHATDAKNAGPGQSGLEKMFGAPDAFDKFVRVYQLLDATVDLMTGGDVWQKLRNIYEHSKMKTVLSLIEDTPNIVLSVVDTLLFDASGKLYRFLELIELGKAHPCDVDQYLTIPDFARKKVRLSSIANFCENFVRTDSPPSLPFISSNEENRLSRNISRDFNETYLLEKMDHALWTVVHAASGGFKEPKVPAWWISFMEGTFKDFLAKYRKEDPRKLAHLTVTKLMRIVGRHLEKEDCTPLNILNSQLTNHQLYSELPCQLSRMNISAIRDVLIRDFRWNETVKMINVQSQFRDKSLRQCTPGVENTLHHVVDIIVDYQNETYSNTAKQCYRNFFGQPPFSRPRPYILAALGILDSLRSNVFVLDTARYHKNLNWLSKMSEKYVQVWKPLSDVVQPAEAKNTEAFLPGAMINVNAILDDRNSSLCWTNEECRNATLLYERLRSKKAGKLLRYDAKMAGYPPLQRVADRLSQSLDLKLISRSLKSWRMEAAMDMTWLRQILDHLIVVTTEGGDLLDLASMVDFDDVSNILGAPEVVNGVVNILREKTVDKLFDGMKEIAEDVQPFIEDQGIVNDIHRMIAALETMEIFKNLGLLNIKYLVRDMFDNWDTVSSYLVEKIGISNDVASTLSQARIDMISVFMKEKRAFSLKDTVCSPTKLNEMLRFNGQITAEEVSDAICQLEDARTRSMMIAMIKNLNFDYIFKTLMSANVKVILANANLTEAESKAVVDNIGVIAELMPFFKERFSSNIPSAEPQKSNTETEDANYSMSTSKFLEDASKMLCGEALVSDNGDLYKIISKIEDNSKEYDRAELDSLPTDFCRDTYKSFVAMGGGKIIWSYVKPLLRGQILYAPNTTTINGVMKLANKTFAEMENFGMLMDSFQKSLNLLVNLTTMSDSLNVFQDMSSDVMKIAIKSFGGGNFDGDLSEMNFTEISWQLKKSKHLITMVGMLNDLLECVLVNRVRGFRDEEEMEAEARLLMETREFLAGVVFLENKSERSRRSLDQQLPRNVVYKIRMDVDYVQSTKRLKNQFWIPGPESSFIEHLRYLRGFVQLQDSIDRAIIAAKSGRSQDWKTVTQQMPYPCWKDVPFQTTLYESQGIQVCFFFALMMCVGAAVRHIVWERESQNAMVMSVMGLKPWRNTVAWFITTFIELLIVMFSIALILLAGKILPKSDPLLILTLMIDYSFSIVTFCYMISTVCSSASLAAITTVVMFLLTFMPYVIVIAMEAVLGLGYKLLICLSMSTSFCYGCLYAARKEVQGVGLTWSNMWEEGSPGDSMTLGLILLMIAFDGCLYATIGYLIARYTNSDEESDASSLVVNEKQTGVSFKEVRKVYNSDQGEVVAVDNFTLKLCEGEVTSLLGRNGAGKTTIIKMLTGMLDPTTGEICLNGEEDCKPDIGVCPQDNVLIGTLTPREHMIFYAKLKRPKESVNMQRSVDEMLTSLELGKQEHEPVHRLSGGTKRRLCVALAFLGSPKMVILDEPGAGVDPAARRRIWRLIDQHRIGRTVILSTHHLDEADMLSDTVVVMHKGKILCTGSPLSLKMTHGRGYRLLVSFPGEQRDSATDTVQRKRIESLKSVIEEVIPNAETSEISGTEVVVTLPLQGKNGVNNIAQAAKVLEDSRKIVGYSHFSLECDTLERVFLDLCSRAESGSTVISASQDSIVTVDHVGLSMPNDEVDLIGGEPALNPTPIRQVKALLKKRMWHFRKDWMTFVAGLLLPTTFVAVAMGFSLIRPPSGDEPALPLTPKLYDTHPTYFYSIDNGGDPFLQNVSFQLHDRFGDDYAGAWQMLPNDTGTCQCLDGHQVCQGVSQAIEGLLQVLPGRPTLDWIVSTHQEYIEKRYGGWSLSHVNDEPLFVVWYNNKGHHALPSYLSALNEAILRAFGVQGRLTTLNHPLRLSSDQLNRTSLLQHVADVGVALVLLIAFNLVAAQGSKELVRERLSEEKRILFLAGVHPVTYWTTVLIWDFFVFGLSIGLAVIVFEIFGLSAYVARDNLAGICLLLFLFAWAALPYSYLLEKTFNDSSLPNMVLFCTNSFIGVISLATILVLDILGKSKTAEDIRNTLHNVLLIFPQYALGDALVQISRNDITTQLLEKFHMDTYKSPLGWELLGRHYVFLAAVGAILFALNLTIECRLLPAWKRQGSPFTPVEEDDDVSKERMRVEGGMSEDVLQTVKLRKEYSSVYGTNVAVQNLSLGVQAGKCFGLLGTNGAGKSTTFRMLTTEIIPTSGRIILKGREVGNGPLCNGDVGYCPQSDSLDGFLSPHQCLTIHGEVCGLANVPKAVEAMLKRLDLLKYAHKRVSSLSGGNKRKLCTALSVMAPVSVVLMDEPTSGMDPATKDLVAKTIRRMTKDQTCVILTSHSVAECENLCNRVGILAKAGLRCIGTPQHLKHKFGEGYVAFLRFQQPVSAADLKKALAKYLPQATVSSRQATAARLLLPRSQDMLLSISFNKVKLLAEELKATDYTLSQSSLDQVLVNFSEEMDTEVEGLTYSRDSSNNVSSTYSSRDTIHMETF